MTDVYVDFVLKRPSKDFMMKRGEEMKKRIAWEECLILPMSARALWATIA